MELTDKCKEAFNNWYDNQFITNNKLRGIKIDKTLPLNGVKGFVLIPHSMRYGVYVDFSETVHNKTFHNMVEAEQSYIAGGHSRSEARTFTVEKFNKRYNK